MGWGFGIGSTRFADREDGVDRVMGHVSVCGVPYASDLAGGLTAGAQDAMGVCRLTFSPPPSR